MSGLADDDVTPPEPPVEPPEPPAEPAEPAEEPAEEPPEPPAEPAEPAEEPAEPAAVSPPEGTGTEPSLDDIAAQISALPIGSFLLSTVSTLASIAYGKLAAGQLDDARGAIDAISALHARPRRPDRAGAQARPRAGARQSAGLVRGRFRTGIVLSL